jgi:hypothetical protein
VLVGHLDAVCFADQPRDRGAVIATYQMQSDALVAGLGDEPVSGVVGDVATLEGLAVAVALGDGAKQLLVVIAWRVPGLKGHDGQQTLVPRVGQELDLGAEPELPCRDAKRYECGPAADARARSSGSTTGSARTVRTDFDGLVVHAE